MNRKARDRNTSLFWTIVGLAICFGSIRLSLGHFHKPGPGFFSFLAGLALTLLSFSVFLLSFGGRGSPVKEKELPLFPDRKRTLKMASVLIVLILYIVGMKYIGFFFATLLFLGVLLKGINRQGWLVTCLVSILGALACYGIFQYWLDVQLPKGVLGI